MAIVEADIKLYLSGGAANSDPNASLGGAISSTEWAGAVLHDLFDKVTGDENAASDVEYRGIYVKNNHGSLTWEAVKLWITDVVAGGADIAVALAGEGLNATMETVANENTAPSGETFSAPTTKGAGLSLGDIPAGQRYGIWVRRTATNSAAVDADGATLNLEGDTAA